MQLRYFACMIALFISGCAKAPSNLDSALARCSLLFRDRPQPAQVSFSNSSAEPLSLYWASTPTGDLIHYRNLDPGNSFVQSTYVGHLWVAKTSQGRIVSTFCTAGPTGTVDFGRAPAG
jgi:hypothetical protein